MDVSPPIKFEDDDLFGAQLQYPMYHAQFQQADWPEMANGHGNGMSNGLLTRGFGSQSNMIPMTGLGGAFGDDELANELVDFSGGDAQQNDQLPHPGTNGHTSQPVHFSNVGRSAPIQASRDHLNSFSFNAPMNGLQLADGRQAMNGHQTMNGHQPVFYGHSLGQHQVQHNFTPLSMQSQQHQPAPSMPSLNQGYFRSRVDPSTYQISPQNPAITALQQQYSTPDNNSPNVRTLNGHRHRSSSVSQWSPQLDLNASPNDDTPLTSPMSVAPLQRPLPLPLEQTKGTPSRSKSAQQKPQSMPSGSLTKEDQKRLRRRHAHNVVEQKRRDKINERIGELSDLVPKHRLEDNKRNRQNARTVGPAGSPTSPLGPSSLRRASSMSQPNQAPVTLDERDMTKGNSLDSAVAWTRDLMWLLQRKLEQQSMLLEALEESGVAVPFEIPEVEVRMATELALAMEINNESEFQYSRSDGSGLYVPMHTDLNGRKLHQPNFMGTTQQHPALTSNYQHPEFLEQYTTPPFSNADSQGWTMSPQAGGPDALGFIEEDSLEMDM